MTEDESFNVIYMIQANYPSVYSRQTAAQADAMVKLWATTFVDYDFKLVVLALKNTFLRKKDFPPTIADVNEEIVKIIKPKEEFISGEEAWGKAFQLMKDFGDTLFDEQQQALDDELSKDESLKNAVRACGGLRGIRLCENDNLNTLRAQFIRIYESYSRRKKEELLVPASIFSQIQEKKAYYMPIAEPLKIADTKKDDALSSTAMPDIKSIFQDILSRAENKSEVSNL